MIHNSKRKQIVVERIVNSGIGSLYGSGRYLIFKVKLYSHDDTVISGFWNTNDIQYLYNIFLGKKNYTWLNDHSILSPDKKTLVVDLGYGVDIDLIFSRRIIEEALILEKMLR